MEQVPAECMQQSATGNTGAGVGCYTDSGHMKAIIDMFSGALIRMGKELGIPVPYNEYTYHMIKALEEKNDGKFDYRGEKEHIK